MWYFEDDENLEDDDAEEVAFSVIPEIEENDDFSDLEESIYEDEDDEEIDIDF